MAHQKRPDIKIGAEEVNALIHSYLLESGFVHSAFLFRGESNLDKTPLAKMMLRRGHLTELLVKALLYTEVETHWQKPPGFCNEPFTLLGAHTCKYSAEKDTSALAYAIPGFGGDVQRRNGQENDDDMEVSDSEKNSVPPPAPELPVSRQTLLFGHTKEVFCVACGPVDGNSILLASGSKDRTVKIWKIAGPETGNTATQLVDTIEHCIEGEYSGEDTDVNFLDWSFDNSLLATASSDYSVRLWSVEDGKLKATFKGHTDAIGSVRFSPDGKYLLSSGFDGLVILWSMSSLRALVKYDHNASTSFVADVSWITNTSFACTWTDNLVHVFLTSSRIPFRTFRGHTDEVNAIRTSPTGKWIASVSDDYTARIWNLDPLRMEFKDNNLQPIAGSAGGSMGQNCIHTLRAHKTSVTTCRWFHGDWDTQSSSTGGIKRLATMCDGDSTKPVVCLWDAATGALLKTFNDHADVTYGLCFHPSLPYLATGSMDGRLIFYDLRTFEMIWSWKERTQPLSGSLRKLSVYEIDWSRDGKRVAVGLSTGAVAVLDVSNLDSSS